MRLLPLVHLHKPHRIPRNHPPAACPRTRASELSHVRLCDPACRRTTLRAGSDLPKTGHPVRRSTVAPFWFSPCLVPAPAPDCHRRATSRRSSRGAATLPPRVLATGCIPRPIPPWSNDPAPLRPEHRSPTAGTKVNDQRILKSTHEREVPGPPSRARSDGSLLPLVRSCRNPHNSASAESAGSL